MDFSDKELIFLKRTFLETERYVRKRQYKGFDPYDVLLSRFPFRKLGKWPPILAIQVFKRNPVNLRSLFRVPKQWNPKGLGLFLHGYSILPKSDENRERCEWLFKKLMELRTADAPGLGWGYPFPWASPEKYLPAWSPTSVVSGFIAQGLDAYYRAYGDERALRAMEDICRFLTEALPHTELEDGGYAISYSTVQPDFCYNASLLAAETYARTFAHTRREAYRSMAVKALETVLTRQKSDGSWNYSENLVTRKQRVQIDFHQGFILDSILCISKCCGHRTAAVENALSEGFEFYRVRQFAREGRALWRLPGNYPVDVHQQAQGIITAVREYRHNANRRAAAMAKVSILYALENLYSGRGFWYYRKHKYFTDRTSYMRWSNAWMFLAMAEVVRAVRKD
jgi:hypothetical protein